MDTEFSNQNIDAFINVVEINTCYQCVYSDYAMFIENEYYVFIKDKYSSYLVLHLTKNSFECIGNPPEDIFTNNNFIVMFNPITCVF